jgi:hypothetical protein
MLASKTQSFKIIVCEDIIFEDHGDELGGASPGEDDIQGTGYQ